jgi:prephenate dehydrogenase
MKKSATFTVIGFGRFGQLMAELLSIEYTVSVVARSQASQQRAQDLGYPLLTLEAAARTERVLLCVPISEFEGIIQQLVPLLRPGVMVIDTCSVKVHPAEIMTTKLPADVQILATHPLFGPDSARDGVQGLRLVVCPLRATDEAISEWNTFWEHQGVEIITSTPDEHDRAMAYTQGVTHFVGRILGELDLKPSKFSTKGYEALLQVEQQTSNDTWQLFYDLQGYNPYTQSMRKELFEAVASVEERINDSLEEPIGN